jgi:hypothetical protein
MRRILLGTLGVALGVFARPAFAQQPANPTQPQRAATLGRPTAIPAAQPPSEITQAGAIRPNSARPLPTAFPSNFGAPIPVGTQPGVGIPMNMPNAGGMPMVQPTAPPPRPGSGMPPGMGTGTSPGMQPSVIETRDPTGRIPMGGVIVPSVIPDGGCYDCAVPGMEDPIYGDPFPRLGALDRLRGCGRNWLDPELLLWWNRGSQVPALVTTSSPQFNGIVGRGDTQVLLGGSFGETYRVGMRVGGGRWFDESETRGVDWRLFFVSPTSSTFSASVPPYPLLARPFFNVNAGINTPNVGFGPSAEVIAGPGVATGNVTAQIRGTVWGAEANYRRFLVGNPCARLDLLVGYRYLNVNEELTITERFQRIPNSDPNVGIPAVAGTIMDRFRTENSFHGGQIGLAGTMNRGRWSLDTRATIAFGSVRQTVDINGNQMLTFANGMTTNTPGGLLAVPGANIGRWSQDRFAVVPEVGFNIGWQATDRMKLFVGYNFLYLSSAVRPGEAIDPFIDAARVPNLLPAGAGMPMAGVVRPQPTYGSSGYFIQGISFGLIYRW